MPRRRVESLAGSGVRRAVTLFEKHFQLGDGFEIFRSTGGSLQLDQSPERHDTDLKIEDTNQLRRGRQCPIGPTADDLSQQVQITQ